MLDWARFEKRTSELDLEHASALLSSFVAQSNDCLRELSVEGRARSSVSRLARAIRNSATELGFSDLAARAGDVELSARDETPAALRKVVQRLEDALGEAGRAVEHIQLMATYEGP